MYCCSRANWQLIGLTVIGCELLSYAWCVNWCYNLCLAVFNYTSLTAVPSHFISCFSFRFQSLTYFFWRISHFCQRHLRQHSIMICSLKKYRSKWNTEGWGAGEHQSGKGRIPMAPMEMVRRNTEVMGMRCWQWRLLVIPFTCRPLTDTFIQIQTGFAAWRKQFRSTAKRNTIEYRYTNL